MDDHADGLAEWTRDNISVRSESPATYVIHFEFAADEIADGDRCRIISRQEFLAVLQRAQPSKDFLLGFAIVLQALRHD